MRQMVSAIATALGLSAILFLKAPTTEQATPAPATAAAAKVEAPAPAPTPVTGPFKVHDVDAHRPSRLPDRVVLTWQSDPARSQSVTWRTDATVLSAHAQIAPAEGGPIFVKQAVDVPAITTLLVTDLLPAHYHTAKFENLTPKTKYAYRVGDGVNWSEWFHFTTASDTPEPFSFIYFGDAQNDLRSLWSRVIREAYSDAPKAKFLLHAGDLVNKGERDAEWGEWFQAGGWLNAMVPQVSTPGNHEYVRDDKESPARLTRHWRPQFALPENGPSGFEETAYYLDIQGTRIVSLNSNVRPEDQVSWLDQVLSDSKPRWRIVTFHHPVYSAAKNRDNATIRQLWKPLFDKHRVDLVLTGHDHTYARSGLALPENIAEGTTAVSPEAGTVYVVSVSGPKMYNLERQPFMKRAAEDTQLYQIIHIDGGMLKYEARTAIGEVYDAFSLRKRDGKTNELVEQAPRTPERLRPPALPKTEAAAQ